MIKRILAKALSELFLLVAFLVVAFPSVAADGDEFIVDNLKYRVISEEEHSVQIIGYIEQPKGDLVLPAYIICEDSRYLVTSIGYNAFYSCYSLNSVIIPDYVTLIYSGAFQSCSNLTSVVFPDSLIAIGSKAFTGCENLMSISLPPTVEHIGSDTFWGCDGLTSVVIPKSVTEIGDGAFVGRSLKEISVDEENPKYASLEAIS